MPKLRLTNHMRAQLKNLARDLVTAPAEEAALTDAYQAAAVLVRQTVEKALPPTDMKVLKKYDCARIDDCIRLNRTQGGVTVFRFDGETGPLTTYQGCRTRVFNADEELTRVVNEWEAAFAQREDVIRGKLADYAALIAAASTYQDVLEVWPEAERLRSQFGAGALSVFSADVVARIRQDVATRAKPERETETA
jgi:hypothetical protein